MDANAHPKHDLERVIKFIFGEAPEPFWFLRQGLGGRIFLALQKIWLMVLVKTRAYRYQLVGKQCQYTHHRPSENTNQIIQEAGIFMTSLK